VVIGLTLGVDATEHGPSIGVAYRLGCQGIHIERTLGHPHPVNTIERGKSALKSGRPKSSTERYPRADIKSRWVLYGTEVYELPSVSQTKSGRDAEAVLE